MLELIEISQIKDKSKILQDFSPDNSLWVVSDIKSQQFVLHKWQEKNIPKKLQTRYES